MTICQNIKNEKFASKDWWKLVKQISNINKKQQGICTLTSDNGSAITEDLDKANLLNTFFASQSKIDDSNTELPRNQNEILPPLTLNRIVITPKNVQDILETLESCWPR